MDEKVLFQVRHDMESWRRLLEFLQQENGHLLNRLSEALQFENEADFLERSEYFQGCFLAESDLISLLRKDVTELESLLTQEFYLDGHWHVMLRRYRHLKNEISKLEGEYAKLRNDFTGFLTGV
ncbi:MAG TPA: hypothetical protein VG870_06685 [Chitinophagaceae bacterium]|nr:hypothetical protein [Chitinophagaceae bacterium]